MMASTENQRVGSPAGVMFFNLYPAEKFFGQISEALQVFAVLIFACLMGGRKRKARKSAKPDSDSDKTADSDKVSGPTARLLGLITLLCGVIANIRSSAFAYLAQYLGSQPSMHMCNVGTNKDKTVKPWGNPKRPPGGVDVPPANGMTEFAALQSAARKDTDRENLTAYLRIFTRAKRYGYDLNAILGKELRRFPGNAAIIEKACNVVQGKDN